MPRYDGKTFEERFWSYVDKDGPTPKHCPELGPCWVWTMGTQKLEFGGYGIMFWDGGCKTTHRISWFLHYGKWPNPCALHRCDNPICVRIGHLFEGTQTDNIIDMINKGRKKYARGEAHPNYRKTHCPQGHEYTPSNTSYAINNLGRLYRKCRTCNREHSRLRRLKTPA